MKKTIAALCLGLASFLAVGINAANPTYTPSQQNTSEQYQCQPVPCNVDTVCGPQVCGPTNCYTDTVCVPTQANPVPCAPVNCAPVPCNTDSVCAPAPCVTPAPVANTGCGGC